MAKVLLLTGYILLLHISGCTPATEDNSNQTVFRYNESKGITSLDPAMARNQTIIWPVSQIFNGLVQMDDSLHIQPSIARSWSISADGLEYTFFLRTDVLFHSSPYLNEESRRVIATDFVYSFERILDPSVASPGSWIFEYVDPQSGFTVLNDSVLQIRLQQPFPPFLSILAMPYCSVVPHEVASNPKANFAHQPVGTGPFEFTLWNSDEKLILLKNREYFETDESGNSLPYLEGIAITFIKDKQSEFLEFLKGNLDFLSGVHPAYKDELLTRSGSLNPEYSHRFKMLTQPYLNTEYLGILQEPVMGKDHLLLDKRIRKAINYGFDREKMMKYLRNNLGYPATAGMIPPGLPGHMAYSEGYDYQPDLARQLIREAGFSSVTADRTIELTTTSDYLDLCEYIQFELEKIGIDIEITVSTGGAFRNMVANGNLQFFRGSWIADYADAENYLALFYSGNHAPAGPNYTRFQSAAFDKLYLAASRETDAEKRYGMYRKMDSIVMEQAPVVPLFYDKLVRFTPVEVEGFNPNPMNNLILKTVRKVDVNR
ncbi:MAG: ABC transporter substrate-binding protein [Bacteroidales bacterium]